MKQAFDFRDESSYLFDILKDLSENDLNTKTQFKKWTFNTIIRHLHVWNYAAKVAYLI